MIRWTDLLYRLGGGPQTHHFYEGFFAQQMIGIDDYAYSGMDFRGDSDMALPKDQLSLPPLMLIVGQ